MVAEGEQGEDRLGLVEAAGELDRALQVLARLRHVADAAEDAAEDPVGAAGGARLAEPLGQSQRLLGRVDRQHVVARLHVERGRLLVEADELERGLPVLEQVDALLVVFDRGLALAAMPQRSADLAMKAGHAFEVLLAAVELQALLPYLDCRVHATESQGNVTFLLADAGARRLLVAAELARGAEVGDGLAVGVERGGGVPGGFQELQGALVDRRAFDGVEPRLGGQRGSAAVVLGQQGDDLLRALAGAVLDEASDLEVLPCPNRLGQHPVGHVADQHVLEGQLRLARES